MRSILRLTMSVSLSIFAMLLAASLLAPNTHAQVDGGLFSCGETGCNCYFTNPNDPTTGYCAENGRAQCNSQCQCGYNPNTKLWSCTPIPANPGGSS